MSEQLPEQAAFRTVRIFGSHREQEDATRLYWLGKTIAEKMEETASLVRYAYALQGIDVDAQGSERSVVFVQRPQR